MALLRSQRSTLPGPTTVRLFLSGGVAYAMAVPSTSGNHSYGGITSHALPVGREDMGRAAGSGR